jgi:hypothetical protein
VERFTSQVLTEREMEMALDAFPLLPELISHAARAGVRDRVAEVSPTADGAEVTVAEADYRWTDTMPDLLRPAFRASWPIAAWGERGAVRVRFTAGYGEGLAPPELVEAVKRTMRQLYDRRGEGGSLTDDVVGLCQRFRRVMI